MKMFKINETKRWDEMNKWLKEGQTLVISQPAKESVTTKIKDPTIITRYRQRYKEVDSVGFSGTIEADLNNLLPIEDNSYDNILAGEIIEHLYNPNQMLFECKRVLRNKGRLIISVPNMTGLNHILNFKKELPYEVYESHLFGFDIFMMQSWCEILEMKRVAIYRINCFPSYNLFTSLLCLYSPFKTNVIAVFEK